MKLIKIFIERYKNIENFELDLSNANDNINIIIGNNGQGKSNLLEAISLIFLRNFFGYKKNDIKYKLLFKKDKDIYFCLENEKPYFYKIVDGVEVEEKRQGTILQNLPKLITIYSGERNRIDNDIQLVHENYYKKNSAYYGSSLLPFYSNTDIKANDGSKKNNLWKLLLYLLSYDDDFLDSEYLKNKIGIESFDKIKFRLNIYGNLQDPAQRNFKLLQSNSNKAIVEISNKDQLIELRNKFGYEKDFYVALDNLQTAGVIQEVEIDINKNGTVIPYTSLSEGEKQIIEIYALSKLYGDEDCIFIFDEPAAYLHPKWQGEFIDELKDLIGENISIIVTHSPFLISDLSRENVFRLNNGQVQGVVHTKGRDINSILSDVMDSEIRPKEYEEKINEISNFIDNRNFDMANKLIAELEKDFGVNDSNIITLKMRINLEK